MKAAEKLSHYSPEINITVIDENIEICRQLETLLLGTIWMDGIKYLLENLKDPGYPDWIIPAIPVHVAYEWVKNKLSASYHLEEKDVPDNLAKTLPHPFKGENGELYISNADFICPDNCPEPVEICTYTGKPRPGVLHDLLESIQYNDFRSVVVRSQQLSPGIGGYPPKALFKALSEITTSATSILLSTACRCHGVMHAFKISERFSRIS